jgi:MFS family permease
LAGVNDERAGDVTEAAATATTGPATERGELAPVAEERDLLREIAVGGLAGLIAGIVVGGVGGRAVMRLAALLAPDAVGRFTENGNRIGTITLEGSLGLILFGGLAGGVVVAGVWVVARPWLPSRTGWRVVVSVPLGLALAGLGLISAGNPDFRILGFEPSVVAALLILVALGGPFLTVVDAVLDRWLPRPGPGRSVTTAVYLAILLLGVILTTLVVAPAYLGSPIPAAGVALVVTGVATLLTWSEVLRLRLDRRLIAAAPLLGRGGLVLATLVGLAYLADQVGAILARA